MDLDVLFLGTAGSSPSPRRGLPATLVRRGGDRLLIDCGEGTQRQLMSSVGLVELEELLITHFHADHVLGLPGMLKTFALRQRERSLTVHGPRGLARLKQRCLLAPVSNGNISLMVDLARRNNLPWDAILGAETAGDYKPKPRVYLAACEAFDFAPGDCMMVAAHSNDLLAAAKCGLRSGHIARPNEKGPGTGEAAPKAPVDVAADSLEDLAAKLGA